jgi:purine catabolism regulator
MALEYDMSTYYNIDDDSVIAQELGLPLGVIVQLPLFRESKVRAGVAGLAQMVTGVNVMEVPDIGKWVKPGQLLITTGFAIRDDKEAQQNLILSLVNKGLSGICIKTRRYLEEIPDSMLIQADNYGFPLIELSPDISFDDLIHDVLSAILHEQSAQLLQMLNIHSALMKIMIEGGGLQKIADILTQLLRNPVYVKDILNDRQACNYDQCSDEEMKMLLAAIKDKKMAPGKKNERIQVEIEGKTVNCFNLPMMAISGSGKPGTPLQVMTSEPLSGYRLRRPWKLPESAH